MDTRRSFPGYSRSDRAPPLVFVRALSGMGNASIPEWITAVVAVVARVAAVRAGPRGARLTSTNRTTPPSD